MAEAWGGSTDIYGLPEWISRPLFPCFQKSKNRWKPWWFQRSDHLHPPVILRKQGGCVVWSTKRQKNKPLSCFYQTFHVLHRGVQKTLLPHVPDSEQAGAAEAMVFFASAKNLSIVSFLQLYRHLPLCVFVPLPRVEKSVQSADQTQIMGITSGKARRKRHLW